MTSKHQRFQYREIHRSAIQPATYNPRTIDPQAEDRLRANLARVGLLTTLVWNERTGVLVGGHQRLRIVDELEGSTDYMIGVAVVDLDEQQERELNVFLNNTWAQGEFDPEKVMALIATVPDVTAMGWTPEELMLEYGARPELAPLLPPPPAPAKRLTAQDTLGPHVMLVFRNNRDKEQFLRHVDRPDAINRMSADEIRDYLKPEHDWRVKPAA